MTITAPPDGPTGMPPHPWWTRLLPGASMGALAVLERNAVSWRGRWLVFVSVLLEPVLFLLSIGVGVGTLVGEVDIGDGRTVPYRLFVGGGLLASSAMFGPVYDTTYNFFVKLKYRKVYDAILATPVRTQDVIVGELLWSQVRGAIYAAAFLATMVAMGLVESWWAVLAVPVAALIGFAFAGVGLAASTYMRSFVDFDWVNVGIIPLFLLSAIFFPLSRYPDGWRTVVQLTPLYQGVRLERALVLGDVSVALLPSVAYLAAMGAAGLYVASRRMRSLLQP